MQDAVSAATPDAILDVTPLVPTNMKNNIDLELAFILAALTIGSGLLALWMLGVY